MSNETKIVTPKFTTCFPAIFRPKEFNGKEKYQVTMVFKKGSDLSALKELIKETAVESFGSAKGVELPLKDGNKKDLEKYPIFENSVFVQAATQFQPGLVDQKRQPILDEADFYAGCEARAQISAYAWTYQKRKGISFNLINVQKMSDGEKLGGSKAVEDVFSDVESDSSSDDDLGFDID